MHPEVVEEARGVCPVCRMTLEPVRLDTIWSCPVHSVVGQRQAGRCPICRRDLVQVTMAITWSCPDDATVRTEPTRCGDGSAAVERYAPRPHGNHNPQHGGAFFMAPDNWHHLEGAYPRAGIFRVYLYDDYSKPLAREEVRRVTGRVLLNSQEVPLAANVDGAYLEAHIPPASFPLSLTAMVRFPAASEFRFDFSFTTYSDDAPSPTPAAPFAAPVTTAGTPTETLMHELHERAARIASAVDRRAYSEIWVPALEAKDLALAVEARAPNGNSREGVSAAVKEIVRAAWMLDQWGDLGNAQQIADAHTRFTAAVAQLDVALR